MPEPENKNFSFTFADVKHLITLATAAVAIMLPLLHPVTDQGAIDASVEVAMNKLVESATAKMDAKARYELSNVKDSLQTKMETLKDAVIALRELIEEKLKYTQRDLEVVRQDLRNMQERRMDLQKKVDELNKQIRAAESVLRVLEEKIGG